MTISAGDKLPDCTLKTMGDKGPQDITTGEIFDGKKVVMFAVPGAFTPGCSLTHLPGFVVNADNIKAAGVDTIVCLSVNDAFVMGAWGDAQNASEILMLADGNGEFSKKLGLDFDGSGFGMGARSRRYSMLVDDGVVSLLNLEEGAGVDVSSAENMLDAL